VRWECECQRCLSVFVEQHHRLVNEGAAYRCQNVSCRLNRVVPRPRIEPEQRPTPVPIPASGPRVSPEYTRYVRAMRELWGHPESSIVGWNEFKMLDGDHLKRIMAPVERAERQRELEEQGKAFERQLNEEFKRKYGIQ
jgi:hypothetical protein